MIVQEHKLTIVQYIADETKKEIIDLLQEMPFSLADNGSTDANSVKLYLLVVSSLIKARSDIRHSFIIAREQ